MTHKRFLIIVGLPKSGTTFLYAECAKRPDIFAMPRYTKEVDYFRRGAEREAYLNLFDEEGDKVVVDASPLYIDHIEFSITNIKKALGDDAVRIVVCLRDPLERAFSHYLHDIAQHQKILGHADYSFWSPSVMAKYVYPLAPRIRFLQERFGYENVWGFSFGSDLTDFQDRLRNFAGLDDDWQLDLGHNPAPGFTSPQVWYNDASDSEVPLRGDRYLLPKGQLLVVNRQYSILRKRIHGPLAEQLAMRQSSLTRQFDTGMLDERTRQRLYDDMAEAARLMDLPMPLDRSARVMHAKPSDELPDHILQQLTPLGSLDEAVAMMMETGIQPSVKTTVSMPHAGDSIAREMARMQLQQFNDPSEKGDRIALMQSIVEKFGPVPIIIESMMHWHVARGRYDEALALFDGHGGADRLLWPMDMAIFLRNRNLVLPPEIATRFEAAGIRVELPV